MVERKKKASTLKDKLDKAAKYDDGGVSEHHMKLKLMTKLNKGNTSVLVVFKGMELSVTESTGDKTKVKEKTKYSLGDIGLWMYCSRVKEHVMKGYEIEEEISNQDEVFREERKVKKVEKDVIKSND